MKLRVMLISGSYPPMKCGVGAYTKKLAESLAAIPEITVSVLTDLQARKYPHESSIEVMPVINGWRVREALDALSIIWRWKPDIVHIQYPTQGYLYMLPLILPISIRLLGIKCVQTWHEFRLRKYDFLLTLGLDALISVRKELMRSVPKLTRFLIGRVPFIWIPGAPLLPTANLTPIQRDEIRHRFVPNHEILLVYYGFMAPLKGVETLFEVMARMSNTKLVMVFDLCLEDSYHRSLLDKINQMNIYSRVVIQSFLPDDKLAELLASSDAVVLPFRDGAGYWNTSVEGAASQGVFVLTTSQEKNGYDAETNICHVAPGNGDEMIFSLKKYAGKHIRSKSSEQKWNVIAQQHVDVYRNLLNK